CRRKPGPCRRRRELHAHAARWQWSSIVSVFWWAGAVGPRPVGGASRRLGAWLIGWVPTRTVQIGHACMTVEPTKTLLTLVLVTPVTGTPGTFVVVDLPSAVGKLGHTLQREEPQTPRFLPKLVTIDGEAYRDMHGVLIQPHGAATDFPAPDIVIIPE